MKTENLTINQKIGQIKENYIRKFFYLSDSEQVLAALENYELAQKQMSKLLEDSPQSPKVWVTFSKFIAIGWALAILVTIAGLFVIDLFSK